MASYQPISGVTGSLTVAAVGGIASYTYPIDAWGYVGTSDSVPVTSICSNLFSESLQGIKHLQMTFTGVAAKNFNPFVAPGNIQLNTFVTLVFTASDDTYATCPTALVTGFNYRDEANGLARYTITAIGSWTFNNFNDQPA